MKNYNNYFFVCVWDSQSAAEMSFAHEWMASCFLSIRELIVRKKFINYVNKKKYYIVDWRYRISLLTFNLKSHSFTVLTHEILSWTREGKFHCSAHSCIIPYLLPWQSHHRMLIPACWHPLKMWHNAPIQSDPCKHPRYLHWWNSTAAGTQEIKDRWS